MIHIVAATVDAVLTYKHLTKPLPSAQKAVDAIAIAVKKHKERHGNIGWIRKAH